MLHGNGLATSNDIRPCDLFDLIRGFRMSALSKTLQSSDYCDEKWKNFSFYTVRPFFNFTVVSFSG